MQPHRPKALDDLNNDFFSPDFSSKKSGDFDEVQVSESEPISDTKIDFSEYLADNTVPNETESTDKSSTSKVPKLPKKDPSQPYSKDEIFELLAEDFSALDGIIGNAFTDDGTSQNEYEDETPREESEKVPLVDEKTAYESFPDISQSIIDLAAKPHESEENQKQKEKDSIKRAKEDAKNSIENEKKKIREQKKLEKTVQRPFGKRRAAVIFTIIFLVIGVVASLLASLMYAIEKTDDGMLKVADFTLVYVDGDKISGDERIGEYIITKSGRIQGNDTLLFLDSTNRPAVADVVGFGAGLYAVDLGSSIYRLEQSKIIGSAKFISPNLALVRNAVAGYSFVVFACLAIYLILVILFASLRISKLNSAIKKLKENYELI